MTEQASSGKNSDQIEYWNSANGKNWVANQVSLDRLMGALTERLFEHAAIQEAERIIDIGCGTGATALRAAQAAGPDGQVLGIDLSNPMLDLARARAQDQARSRPGAANLRLEIADAQSHAFAPGAFDLLQSRFGVMFFEDPSAAFANLLTALRPGGRLCFVCWAGMENNPWFRIPARAAARHLAEPEPPRPRAPGPMAFAEADYVAGILRDASFHEVRIETETCLLIGADSVAETARFALRVGPASKLIKLHAPAPETIAAIGAEIEAALTPYDGGQGPRIPVQVHFVLARAASE